jgi:hypothetical protein
MHGREFLGCAALIKVLVEPGPNSTFTSALAFFRPTYGIYDHNNYGRENPSSGYLIFCRLGR